MKRKIGINKNNEHTTAVLQDARILWNHRFDRKEFKNRKINFYGALHLVKPQNVSGNFNSIPIQTQQQTQF